MSLLEGAHVHLADALHACLGAIAVLVVNLLIYVCNGCGQDFWARRRLQELEDSGVQVHRRQPRGLDIETLLRGDAIMEELSDTECDTNVIVKKSTAEAKQLIRKCPVMLFGLSRQGKSTMVNDWLAFHGNKARPAQEDDMQACTTGVRTYRKEVSNWSTSGVSEEVLFLDTEGWEFGDSGASSRVSQLLQRCMETAVTEKIMPDVLNHRLILVLMLSVEHRENIYNDKFMALVLKVCEEAAAAAKGGRLALLPVLTKTDLFHALSDCATARDLSDRFTHEVKSNVAAIADVFDAIVMTSMKNGSKPSSEGIKHLDATLKEICRAQLKSEHIVAIARDLIQRDLKKALTQWDKDFQLDHPAALARRFVWSVARHHGASVEGLSRLDPWVTWSSAEDVVQLIKRAPPLGDKSVITNYDELHTDKRRARGRRLDRDPSA